MLVDQARPSDQVWSDSVSPDFTSLQHVRSSLQVAAGTTGWLSENLWVLILLLTVHMVQLYLPILGPVAFCALSRYNDSRSNFLWRVFVSLDDPLMERNPLRPYPMSGVAAKTTNLCLTQLRYRDASITVFMIKSYSFGNQKIELPCVIVYTAFLWSK